MIVIHPDRVAPDESYSERWLMALTARGVPARLADLRTPEGFALATQAQGVMWRWLHNPDDRQSARVILHALESGSGLPVFPSVASSWHYDDKVAQKYLLDALGAPQPRTWVFWSRDTALEWLATAPLPLVAKLASGAGSSNVRLLADRDAVADWIHRAFGPGLWPYHLDDANASPSEPTVDPWFWRCEKNVVYFQEFVPDNDGDTRVTVIGERIFGYRRRNRPGDFRASGSGLIDYDPAAIDPRCLRIAFELSRRAGFQSMAYDFLSLRGQPVLCELSYTFVDRLVAHCPGHWHGPECAWREGALWPQEAQVDVFLAAIAQHRSP